MRPRYKLAVRTARNLLERAGISAPPVDVYGLADLLGAVVRSRPFEGDLSGMVVRRQDGTAVIGVNQSHHRNRQRFTIAHEIGHLLLHRSEQLHIDERFPIGLRDSVSSQAIDPREIEANQFAAELLMPEQLVREDVGEHMLDAEQDDRIRELAVRYEVSTQSMTIRLTRFGLLG